MNDLTVVKNNPISVFTEADVLDSILSGIEAEVTEFVPCLDTPKDRKEIASLAYKVTKSKTLIDAAGKELVADWKSKAKKVDESRRKSRVFLDDLRDRVRLPLTEWEVDEAEKTANKKAEKEFNDAWENALFDDDLFNRRKAIEKREADIAAKEAAKREEEGRIEAAKIAEKNKLKVVREKRERDDRIRREAELKAKRESEEKAAKDRRDIEQKLIDEREAKECAIREKIAAEERAKAEKEYAIKKAKEDSERDDLERKAAEERAHADKKRAIKRAREDSEKEAKEHREDEERAKAESAEKERIKAANKMHQRSVNRKIVAALVGGGISEADAKAVVSMAAEGLVPGLIVRY